MRTRWVEEREGEHLGPIDWTYDFLQHQSLNPTVVLECKKMLHLLEDGLCDGKRYEATTDGGSPKIGWHAVISVGMYDGWPYWKPTPSVLLAGPLGPEWHSWWSVIAIKHIGGAA